MQLRLLASLSALCLSVASATPHRLVELHVQQQQQPLHRQEGRVSGGSDGVEADGSAARPFGTIHEARDRIRQLRRQGPTDRYVPSPVDFCAVKLFCIGHNLAER